MGLPHPPPPPPPLLSLHDPPYSMYPLEFYLLFVVNIKYVFQKNHTPKLNISYLFFNCVCCSSESKRSGMQSNFKFYLRQFASRYKNCLWKAFILSFLSPTLSCSSLLGLSTNSEVFSTCIMRRSNRNFNIPPPPRGIDYLLCREVGNLTFACVGWGKLNRKSQVANSHKTSV